MTDLTNKLDDSSTEEPERVTFEELDSYESEFYSTDRKIFDRTTKLIFSGGVGFSIYSAAQENYWLMAAGLFTVLSFGAIKGVSAYVKKYYNPKNKEIRRRIESGEQVTRSEFNESDRRDSF